MSGSINYNQTSSGLHWTVDNGDIFFLRPYSHGNILQITKKRNGTEWGAMNFHEDGSFELTAYNGEEGKGAYSLRGAMDGRLFWRNQNMIFVKESWVSGTSWYRVWSDGYIEQGGQFNSIANINASNTTISFIKPFSSVVLVLGGFTKTSNSGSYGQNIFQNGATTLTSSVVSLPAYSNSGNIQHSISTAVGYWYAFGY